MKRWFLSFVPVPTTPTGMGFLSLLRLTLQRHTAAQPQVEYVESVPAEVRLSVLSAYVLSEIKTYS